VTESRETAGVVAPPPLILLGAIVVATALKRLWPLPLVAAGGPKAAGVVVAAVGLGLELAAIREMRRAGTDVQPWRPTKALVTGGPYRWSRNPIYVGLLVLQLGLALLLNDAWVAIMIAPVALVLHFGVVLREERYLSARLGADYVRYRDSVRRWL
jgi:protein-S-isoprenylcysteine O-methyltransferase Ste14